MSKLARETLQKALFTRDSIILWGFKTYHKKRREYPLLFKQPEYDHLEVVHMRSPKSTQDWLSSLSLLTHF